jgi:hypothetical protein
MASVTQPGPAPASPPVAETLQQRLTRWYKLKEQLADLGEQERTLRASIFSEAFPKAPEKGTSRYGIGHGKDLKATTKVNYTVDREALGRLGNAIPSEVRDRVFRHKPEVVEAQLAAVLADKTTPEDVRRALAECVTSKPGTPTLEIVDAKARA